MTHSPAEAGATSDQRRSRTVAGAAVAIIFIVTILRVVSTYGTFSQTVDEPIHAAAGYQWLAGGGQYNHDPEHPPLARIGFGLGAFLEGASVPPGSHGNNLLYRDGRYEHNLELIRGGNLPFLILALAAVFIWAKRLFGAVDAVIALALFATLPPILGHAGLATTDLAVTATTTLALLALAAWLERPTWRRAIALGVATGLGVLSKFSFLIFFPVAAIGFVIAVAALKRSNGAPASAGEKSPAEAGAPFAARIGQVAAMALLVFFMIWGAYRFSIGTIAQAHLDVPRTGSALHIAAQYAKSPGYEWVRADLVQRYRRYGEYAEDRGRYGIDFVDWAKAAGFPSPLAGRSGSDTMKGAPPIPVPNLRDRLFEPFRRQWQRISLRVPLPAPFFISGLELVAQHSRGGHPAFLLGSYSDRGWWYYFPVVWFFKTPLPFVVLTVAGIAMVARRAWKTRNAEMLGIAIAPVMMFVPTMLAGINIGVRHILPLYPLMAIVAAFTLRELWNGGSLRRGAAIALMLWQLVSTSLAHPDYLAWFNELAGNRPDRIAVDSNLDWGQDLLRLVEDVRHSNIDRLYLSYFGSADPKQHALPAEVLPPMKPVCGWIAVSEMNMKFGGAMSGKANRGQNLRWLQEHEPVRKVGKSIRMYFVECK